METTSLNVDEHDSIPRPASPNTPSPAPAVTSPKVTKIWPSRREVVFVQNLFEAELRAERAWVAASPGHPAIEHAGLGADLSLAESLLGLMASRNITKPEGQINFAARLDGYKIDSVTVDCLLALGYQPSDGDPYIFAAVSDGSKSPKSLEKALSNVTVCRGLDEPMLVKWRYLETTEEYVYDQQICVDCRMYVLSGLSEDRAFQLRPVGTAAMATSIPNNRHPALTTTNWTFRCLGPKLNADLETQPGYLRLAIGISPQSSPAEPRLILYRPTDGSPEWVQAANLNNYSFPIQDEARDIFMDRHVPPQACTELVWWKARVAEEGESLIARVYDDDKVPMGGFPPESTLALPTGPCPSPSDSKAKETGMMHGDQRITTKARITKGTKPVTQAILDEWTRLCDHTKGLEKRWIDGFEAQVSGRLRAEDCIWYLNGKHALEAQLVGSYKAQRKNLSSVWDEHDVASMPEVDGVLETRDEPRGLDEETSMTDV